MIEYPEYIELGEKKYRINTDYRTALKVIDLIEDNGVSDWERSIGVIVMLFGRDCPVNDESLELARKYLQCGAVDGVHDSREVDIDLNHDSKYIVASFQKEYGIDIATEGMHWWKFFYLIEGLGEDCVLSRVRQIRNEDLSDYKDRKTRKKLIEAKRLVALPVKYSREQVEKREKFMKLLSRDTPQGSGRLSNERNRERGV